MPSLVKFIQKKIALVGPCKSKLFALPAERERGKWEREMHLFIYLVFLFIYFIFFFKEKGKRFI